MFLVMFKKERVEGKIHVVYGEPLDVASSIVSLDPKMEARAFASLRHAVKGFTPGLFDAGRVLGIECRGLLVVFIIFFMLYRGVDG
jgi:hypothetical protein